MKCDRIMQRQCGGAGSKMKILGSDEQTRKAQHQRHRALYILTVFILTNWYCSTCGFVQEDSLFENVN
jgi:hypothetical protein